MSKATLLQLHPNEAARRSTLRSHHIAGCHLLTDRPIRELEPFRAPQPVVVSTVPELPSALHDTSRGTLVYRGQGMVAGKEREITCTSAPGGVLLHVQGLGPYWIDSDGRRAARLHDSGNPTEQEIETVLGPVLVLALALQATFCLHASAIAVGDGAIGFCGSSGSGKSTLALEIERRTGLAWRRLADDILPVSLGPVGPVALPHFPQLKLPPEGQPGLERPARMPLVALFLIDGASEEVRVDVLQPRDAMLAMVGQTVASRLFDSSLSAIHMAFCTRASGELTVAKVSYPRRLAAIPLLQAAIADVLGQGQASAQVSQ